MVCASCAAPLLKLPSGPGVPAQDASDVIQAGDRRVPPAFRHIPRDDSVGIDRRRPLSADVSSPVSRRLGAVRLEAVAPAGQPVFFLTNGIGLVQPDATLLLPRDNRVLERGRFDAVLEAVTGIPIDASLLFSVLTGCVPSVRRHGKCGSARIGVASLAVCSTSTCTAKKKDRGAWWRCSVDRSAGSGWRAEYGDFQDGLPRSIRLVSASPGAFDLQLALSQVELNPSLGDDVFRIQIPASAKPITLDELKASGPLGSEWPLNVRIARFGLREDQPRPSRARRAARRLSRAPDDVPVDRARRCADVHARPRTLSHRLRRSRLSGRFAQPGLARGGTVVEGGAADGRAERRRGHHREAHSHAGRTWRWQQRCRCRADGARVAVADQASRARGCADWPAAIGADVPYFLEGGTALGRARGDRLSRLHDIPRAWVVLVVPRFGVSTAEAFGWWDTQEDRSTTEPIGTAGPASRTICSAWCRGVIPIVSRLVVALERRRRVSRVVIGQRIRRVWFVQAAGRTRSAPRRALRRTGPRRLVLLTRTLSRQECRKLAAK